VSEQIQPTDFAKAMGSHWCDRLGNVVSPSLMALWETMAQTFNGAMTGKDHRWAVLQPPTGTGKTQGLSLFSAMTANANREGDVRRGILIVTRLIEQADELKASIDQMAGFECAVTKHSDNNITSAQMRKSDVLIVTHAAYVMALDALREQDDSRWSDLIEWEHGKRSLTVIDEALDNVIEAHQINADDIRRVLAYVTPELRSEFTSSTNALDMIISLLEQVAVIVQASEDDEMRGSRIIWRGIVDGREEFPAGLSTLPLRKAMAGLKYDHKALQKESPQERQRIASLVDGTLKDVEAILSKWSYYAKKGLEHTFNASQFLIPDDLPGPVVLDATASQNFLWELLEERADIKPIPPNTRNYRNVTLHVARASGVGKTAMLKDGKNRIPRLLAELETLGSIRKVFLCLHKGNEHIPLQYSSLFEQLSVGHWGAIDGRNDWKDCDTVVIFGLPYRDHIWATNTFFAIKGLQGDGWLRNPQWKSYADVREELQAKQITVSVVQAINRIQCRKVIDDQGNCPPSDVFIVLPQGFRGDRYLDAIKQEMPGIGTKGWEFSLDGAEVTVRKGSSHEALLTYMTNAPAGETPLSSVRQELELKPEGFKSLKAALKDNGHPLTAQLKGIGVTLITSGYGRGSKSYLLKT